MNTTELAGIFGFIMMVIGLMFIFGVALDLNERLQKIESKFESRK